MTKMIIDVPTKYDKMLGRLKAEKEYSSKSMAAVKIIETFFKKNMEVD